MANLSIKLKLLALFVLSLAFLFINIFVFTIFINKNNKTFEDIIYKQGLESTQLILNADRDFYQALIALQGLEYNKNANRKQFIDDYSENASQVLERANKAKEILSADKNVWSKYKSKETGKTIYEEFDAFSISYNKWENTARLLIAGRSSFAIQEKAFSSAREHLNTITDTLNDGANEKIKEINTSSNRNITIILVISIGLSVVLFGAIFTIVSKITGNLAQIINNLTEDSDKMQIASEQLSDASQNLASGAVEQASAIQETSATLEETSSMVQQNRENTTQAAILAKQAKQYAEQSNDEVEQMSCSMNELKNSSNEIAKIIKVIDEIAFQTNILSLNAAVEAARAGEAGKGFAVVAEEVRNLAQRSAQAAKDTTTIIESNVNLSENSVSAANSVRKSVAAITEQALKVSEILDEISIATDEQTKGVDQINKAVSQMEITQSSNAHTAEDAASASSFLQEQVINVREIVDSLVVLVEGAGTMAANRELLTNQIMSRHQAGQIEQRRTISLPTLETVRPVTTYSDTKKTLITWTDSYSVGFTEMDNQHQQLISMINDLYDAMQTQKAAEQIGKILNRLISYTKTHFSKEEEYMKKYSYPDMERHIKEHHAFIDKVLKFKSDFESGRTSMSVSVTSFLKDWLMNHISVNDKKYGNYYNEHGLI